MASAILDSLYRRYTVVKNHAESDYFGLISEFLSLRNRYEPGSGEYLSWQREIDLAYQLVRDELVSNQGCPLKPVTFGTSGWRGILGKDIFVKSVAQVTMAIVEMYLGLASTPELCDPLGVETPSEARRRGCVVGFDNRFGGELLARSVVDVLTANGFLVHYGGEATTGTLSTAVLEMQAAFSINLTPSHNPFEYGGFKYNAADAGPAAKAVTDRITALARERIAVDLPVAHASYECRDKLTRSLDALACWVDHVRANTCLHGLDYDQIMAAFEEAGDLVVAVDCVHGASRLHMERFFKHTASGRLVLLRHGNDPTFGGIQPEPSTANLGLVKAALEARREPLKLGAIIDPDGDRIRFTDGKVEITMNHFGAMAYHFLHEIKGRTGLVAKTVATSNFANALAGAFGEEVFEPPVGFKEFKPVIDRALVCFEESDGITVIGHTPEKDAYIGLLAALDMMLVLRRNLGDYLRQIEEQYGSYFPAKDGVTVSQEGQELLDSLAGLERYTIGSLLPVGEAERRIVEVVKIDGRKMIFDDGSWLMVRPSGTEPKVRFYVEARDDRSKAELFDAARRMVAEIGLLP